MSDKITNTDTEKKTFPFGVVILLKSNMSHALLDVSVSFRNDENRFGHKTKEVFSCEVNLPYLNSIWQMMWL